MFPAARTVLLSMRASEDIGCAESAAEQIKLDCCRTPAVVSIFPDSAACVLSFYRSTTPLHLTYLHRTHRDPAISWHFISFYTDCSSTTATNQM